MKITIHRGAHQIGGNCVEVSTGSTRLILDVGLPLDDLAAPAPVAEPEPRADGVVSAVFAQGKPVAAVLISHAHADHTGLLDLVPQDTPICLSKGTSKMMLAGSLYARQISLSRERQRVLEVRYPHQIGDITVTAFPVDHSAFDAQAFLLEADGQRVLYSGDLRLHGRKPGMAKTLIEAMQGKPPDVLIMEGTHFSEDRQQGLTEEQLEDVIAGDIKSAPGLVLAAFSPMHVDRLVTFYKAARRAGRIFLVDHYSAYIFFLVSTQARIPKPERGAGIRVFLPKRRKRITKLEDRYGKNLIYLDEVISNPSAYVMPFRPSMLDGDFAAGLPAGARCIYSYWHGYLQKPDWQQAQAAVAACGGQFIERHTSGHIHAADIVRFVEAIQPRHVVPIHTTRPDEFEHLFANALLLEDGETFKIVTQENMEFAESLSPMAKKRVPVEKRLFRLKDGYWLQTRQEGQNVEVRGFGPPFETTPSFVATPYQYPHKEVDILLEGASEVSIRRLRQGSPYAVRPEIREATLIPQDEAAIHILRTLAEMAECAEDRPPLNPRNVPQTCLRRFYDFLTFFHNYRLHKALANFVAEPEHCCDTLGKLFGSSIGICENYNNPQAFHPIRVDDWRQNAKPTSREAIELRTRIGRVRNRELPVSNELDETNLKFKAVAYEVSPLRSTEASARDSGGGGIDLLFRSEEEDKLPIIAEVKAPNDKNMFFALVQALTYASELTTEKQFKRLSRFYPEAFASLYSGSPRCDIYLVYFKQDEPKLMVQAQKIAGLLLGSPNPVASSIRRIAFVETTPQGDPELKFTCRRVFWSQHPVSSSA